MRKYILFSLLQISGTTGFTQRPVALFEEASAFYHDGELDSALLLFKKIWKKGLGDESLQARAYFNIALINQEKKNYKIAKEIYTDILDKEYDEMEKGGVGSGIMGDPYALYKHNSCSNLAQIALIEKEYSKALEYTRLFDKVYPYRHFCGNELSANQVYVAYTYARCHIGLGDTAAAIADLLPVCLFNAFASNDPVQEMAIMLINSQYSCVAINQKLEKAMDSIYYRNYGSGKNKYRLYFISFLGSEMRLTAWYSSLIDKKDREAYMAMTEEEQQKYLLKQDPFLKRLKGVNLQGADIVSTVPATGGQ